MLSVAIAARNHARFLPRALHSALRAGRVLGLPFEIVVVDDASTDETREALEQFRLDYPDRVRVLYRSTTRGVAVAKNTALAHCRGRWVALLDADDEFCPEKLARCVAVLTRGGVDFVTHDYIHYRSPTEQYPMTPRTWSGSRGDFWPPSTWVFPNGRVWFNEQMVGYGEDLEWVARRRPTWRHRHLQEVLNLQHEHGGNAHLSEPCRIVGRQVFRRIVGDLSEEDRRAALGWACRECGRQLLLPALCCGRPAQPAPLVFYSYAQSPHLPASPPEFSFVFLTKDRVELTRRAVESLLPHLEGERTELIFVDGGSTDGTLEAIREWAARLPVKLICIPREERFNYSRNGNRGARAAEGTFLCLVNNDVEVVEGSLLVALRAALSDARVGVAGVSSTWRPTHRDPEWDWERSLYVFTRRPLMGHFWAARREVYWALGGLDESFEQYGYEELDLEYRATLAHYRLALVAARVAHRGAATFRAVYGEALAAMARVNEAIWSRKHGQPIYLEGDQVQPFARYQPPTLSLVMVGRNAGAALCRSLESVAADPRARDGSRQLVVVDNASEDETRLVLAEFRRRLPRLLSAVELPQPLPYGRALARGRARAIGGAVRTVCPGDRLSMV